MKYSHKRNKNPTFLHKSEDFTTSWLRFLVTKPRGTRPCGHPGEPEHKPLHYDKLEQPGPPTTEESGAGNFRMVDIEINA